VNLLELLKRPEGKTLEFKRDLSSPEGVLRSLVAFANTAGGTVLVGVEDRTRHVRGVLEPLDLEERLANLISDSIVPACYQSWSSFLGGAMWSPYRCTPAHFGPTTCGAKVLTPVSMSGWARPIEGPIGS
jgi:hypothetical protein